MCGFAGYWTSKDGTRDRLATTAEAMARTLAHRGPDQEGVWVDDQQGVALGFRRLAIVDLSSEGHQPMQSGSGRFVVTFNGEIYNFEFLRKHLLAAGHRFRGHSDTEVLLAGFEEWGVAGTLPRLNGMFAFSVWDRTERVLTLARDPLGIKPLYVARGSGMVCWGSELKALAGAPGFDKSLDVTAVDAFLRYLYVPAPLTIYRHARKLLPGSLLRIASPESDLGEPEPYWSLLAVSESGRNARISSPDECVERLEELLVDAVKLQMVADVPLGALLSGGIDSSTVVALMQEASSQAVKTFTIGFDEAEHDESGHARAIAAHLGTEHTEVRLSAQDALDVVPMLPEMFDEPHADPSQIPTFLVSQLARSKVTVALTGDGGDELFGGYNRYSAGASLISRATRVPWPARSVVARGVRAIPPSLLSATYRAAAALAPGSAPVRLAGEKIRKTVDLLHGRDETEMYRSLMSAWQRPGDILRHQGSATDRAMALVEGHRKSKGLIEAMMLSDQAVYLPDDLLAKVDRASMAVSLEARVPILDHRVAELAWQMPLDVKIRGGITKWVLRQVLYRRVPQALVDRPKTGFTVPVDAWLRGPLREWTNDMLSVKALERTGVFEPESVLSAWADVQRGRRGALSIWTVMVLQGWIERWA